MRHIQSSKNLTTSGGYLASDGTLQFTKPASSQPFVISQDDNGDVTVGGQTFSAAAIDLTLSGGGNHVTIDSGVTMSVVIHGSAGGDTIAYYGSGDFTVYGGSAANTIIGGSGTNTIYCGNGGDTVIGGSGNNEVYGGADGANETYADNIIEVPKVEESLSDAFRGPVTRAANRLSLSLANPPFTSASSSLPLCRHAAWNQPLDRLRLHEDLRHGGGPRTAGRRAECRAETEVADCRRDDPKPLQLQGL